MFSAFLLLVFILAVSRILFGGKPKNFPPGPIGLPFFGHLLSLGQRPHETLLTWKKTYGPIIGIQLGIFRCVVLNDAKLIREALNSEAVTGRPPVKPASERSGGVAKGVFLTHGRDWLDQRTFTSKYLRESGFGKSSMEAQIKDEIIELMDRLAANAGKPMQMRNAFSTAALNALWSIVIGRRMKQDDPELVEAIDALTAFLDDNNFMANATTFLPWLVKIAPKLSGFEALLRGFSTMDGFANKHVNQHKLTHVDNQPRDYIDAYLDKIKKTTDPSSPFHEDQEQIRYIVSDLFMAGAETISTALTWTFAYMVTYPEVQAKLQKEIDNVVGSERLPSLSDRSSMKYTEAVFNEIMRVASLLPLSVFRFTTEDMEFHGYSIPKGTIIMPNLFGVHYDEDVWGDPERFRPERFLDEEGNVKKIDSWLPFAAGKRSCLGEGVARDEIFLFITHLFRRFQASPAEKLPALYPSARLVLSLLPFEVILTERVATRS